ncbi:hypothetical protein AWH63_10840 [Marinobacter sp. C18]|uniref:hypothetical protein n=1 Tax=Marinobacter sp. C18 TaxID=1772288 RepID=UPI000948E5AE|nr:hypothetical protein [Marinobacter sp. C18]OLF82027.1 hypothetical protein AWH63_10840 [Marinobacter sp. C18]
MPIGATAQHTLDLSGWESKNEIPSDAIDSLDMKSRSSIRLFSAVSEIYEIFHHAETDRWMLVTDGGSSFTVNAPALLIASPNPERLDTDCPKAQASTIVFTIGLDDKTVSDWLVWVGCQNHYPQRRPDRGFHYVS